MSIVPPPPTNNFPRYLYAWMGMDELGSGEVGIKQAQTPAGYIPLAGVDQGKLEKLKPQLQALAARFGHKIYLVRYRVDQVEDSTWEGT